MSEVFVSYNREDLKTAQTIVDGLIAEGFDVWMDMNLQAGENYDEITEDRLHKARAVVVLWSSRSVKSRWVRAEATIGARKNTLVPLMIEPCDRPVMFELIQTTDLSGWSGDRNDPAWLAFVEVIKKRLTAAPVASTGSESRGGGPASAKPRKRVKPVKKRKEQRSGGLLTAVGLTFIFGMVSAAGIYILRPDLVAPVLTQLSAIAAPEAAPGGAATLTAAAADPVPAEPVIAVEPEPVPAPEPVIEETPAETGPVTFRECDMCPDMITVAGGTFQMGAPEEELARNAWEGPQRKVAMAPFVIAATEVTFDQWDACVADGGCGGYSPPAGTHGRGNQPVTKVSWKDAQAYTGWLTKKTGRAYRLPTEAEWEFTARAGTTTPFWWGPLFEAEKSATGTDPVAVDTLPANAMGLRGVSGNVREWVQDCYVNTFANAPLDGRSVEVAACKLRVLRGGSYKSTPAELRIAARSRNEPAIRDNLTGFRVAAQP
ncbi:SUMF1/EgtB/PvdO family nonheme iron enzyme [Hyphomonas sp.]|uniref:SUMF1/EgtB/PvdO family nonheme iron enzyme n=1 Tax=Hyphomonas sp. TaxID=87 RepID=UPI00391C0AA4